MEGTTGGDSTTRQAIEDEPIVPEVETDKTGMTFDQKMAELQKLVENPDYEIDNDVLAVATPENIDRLLQNANVLANAKAKAILEKISGSSPAHRHR